MEHVKLQLKICERTFKPSGDVLFAPQRKVPENSNLSRNLARTLHDSKWESRGLAFLNPLNAELNPICHLLALLGSNHILHISWLRVNLKLG